jgi:hypothetical protein
MVLSNMIGPMEKVAIHGNPIKSVSFYVIGLPQVSKCWTNRDTYRGLKSTLGTWTNNPLKVMTNNCTSSGLTAILGTWINYT